MRLTVFKNLKNNPPLKRNHVRRETEQNVVQFASSSLHSFRLTGFFNYSSVLLTPVSIKNPCDR